MPAVYFYQRKRSMIDERWIDEEGEGDVCVNFGDLQLKNWIDKARSYLNGFLVRPFVCSPRSASNLEALVCGRIPPAPPLPLNFIC